MNDFYYGIAFLVKNKEQILKLCAGTSEALVVGETIEALGTEHLPATAPASGSYDSLCPCCGEIDCIDAR